MALLARGDRKEAAVEFPKALELMQKDAADCNEVAWTLATSPNANQRYGTIAVEFATRACELTGWKEVDYMDTLAAAHAEAGDFDSAVRRQTEAISLERRQAKRRLRPAAQAIQGPKAVSGRETTTARAVTGDMTIRVKPRSQKRTQISHR